MNRRNFVTTCCVTGCAAFSGAWHLESLAAEHGIDAPRLVGEWYLNLVPAERKSCEIVSAIGTAIPGFSHIDDVFKHAGIRKGLTDACAKDFATGNVISIGGFLLARTEARLCALMAMS